MAYYVYMLKNIDRLKSKTYVGFTNNINKRLAKHNSNKGAKSTKGRKWFLVYKESFSNKIDAMKREYNIKNDKIFREKIKAKIKNR